MLTNPPCPIILCASTGDCVCSIQWALSPRSEADEEVLLQVKMQQGIFLLTVDILIPLLNLCFMEGSTDVLNSITSLTDM